MMIEIFILIFVILGTLYYVISRKPDIFQVTRTIQIAAPPEKIFSHFNDFPNWNAWSPWAKLDSGVKNTFENPQGREGAIFRWHGNRKVGQGAMTLVESRPFDYARIRLEFIKPFKAVNQTEFKLTPESNTTQVAWSMTGKSNFMAKTMSLFINCEKMVGAQFDEGLENIKSIVESQS